MKHCPKIQVRISYLLLSYASVQLVFTCINDTMFSFTFVYLSVCLSKIAQTIVPITIHCLGGSF